MVEDPHPHTYNEDRILNLKNQLWQNPDDLLDLDQNYIKGFHDYFLEYKWPQKKD